MTSRQNFCLGRDVIFCIVCFVKLSPRHPDGDAGTTPRLLNTWAYVKASLLVDVYVKMTLKLETNLGDIRQITATDADAHRT